MKSPLALLLALFVLQITGQLYEDEVGEQDWIRQHVGRPNDVFFHNGFVFVSSNSQNNEYGTNIVAGLQLKSGDIEWRHKMPNDAQIRTTHRTNNGLVVETEFALFKFDLSGKMEFVYYSKNRILSSLVFLDGEKEFVFLALENGSVAKIDSHGTAVDTQILPEGKGYTAFRLVEPTAGSVNLIATDPKRLTAFRYTNKEFKQVSSLQTDGVVVTNENSVFLIKQTGIESFDFDLKSSGKLKLNLQSATVESLTANFLIIKSLNSERFFIPLPLTEKYEKISNEVYGVVQTKSGKQVAKMTQAGQLSIGSTSFKIPVNEGITRLWVDERDGGFVLLTLSNTDALSLYRVSAQSQEADEVWTREEGLSSTFTAKLFDLPSPHLFDRAGDISEDANIISQFFSRIYSQVVDLFSMFSKNAQPVPKLEMKDRFNFRKLLLLLSKTGTIFALQTEFNVLLWKKQLPFNLPIQDANIFEVRSSAFFPPQIGIFVSSGNSTQVLLLNPLNGEESEEMSTFPLSKVLMMPSMDQNGNHPLVVIPEDGSSRATVIPNTPEALSQVQKDAQLIFWSKVEKNNILGYSLDSQLAPVQVWRTAIDSSTQIRQVSYPPPSQKISSPARVLADKTISSKYLNTNMIVVLTEDKTNQGVGVYIFDGITGNVLHYAKHDSALNPTAITQSENLIVYQLWNTKTHSHELRVIELNTESLDWSGTLDYSSFDPLPAIKPVYLGYHTEREFYTLTVTDTRFGITSKQVLAGMAPGQIMAFDFSDKNKARFIAEGVAVTPTQILNYDHLIQDLTTIISCPTDFESTTVVLGVGTDIFLTLHTPSGKFDLLSSSFNYFSLILTSSIIFIGAIVSRSFAKEKQLKALWA